MLTSIIHLKAFIFTSALLALATADTCSDCTAVVSTIAARLSSEESVAAQAVSYVIKSNKTSTKGCAYHILSGNLLGVGNGMKTYSYF